MLKFYWGPGVCSLGPHVALEEVGAPYESVMVDLKLGVQKTPAYLAVNPKGRVPALATDRGVLTECAAILAYLAQAFPEAGLAPADPFAFAQMQSFNLFIATSVHVTFTHLFRSQRFADSEAAQAAMKAKVPESLGDYLGLVEERFADGRPWVHGDRYSMSDPYLFVFARWLEREGAGGSARFPRIRAHRARMNERPAVQRTLALEGIPVL